ncbi:hypothetical protein QUF58_08025 [Anaerolineales bacterium HSG24]|nr:hypothetical protein [Anaerolineales bacterium HSG24]
MPDYSLTPDQVLQDIKTELNRPAITEPALVSNIKYTRQLQQQFRQTPVIGALVRLKRVFYSLVHSTFSQQYDINDSLLNLIEDIYNELNQSQAIRDQKMTALQHQVETLQQATYTRELANKQPTSPETPVIPRSK